MDSAIAVTTALAFGGCNITVEELLITVDYIKTARPYIVFCGVLRSYGFQM